MRNQLEKAYVCWALQSFYLVRMAPLIWSKSRAGLEALFGLLPPVLSW